MRYTLGALVVASLAVSEGVTHHAENHGDAPVVYVEINATADTT